MLLIAFGYCLVDVLGKTVTCIVWKLSQNKNLALALMSMYIIQLFSVLFNVNEIFENVTKIYKTY